MKASLHSVQVTLPSASMHACFATLNFSPVFIDQCSMRHNAASPTEAMFFVLPQFIGRALVKPESPPFPNACNNFPRVQPALSPYGKVRRRLTKTFIK
jgi:hypothetical protein